jgi:hypothetical protein
MRIQQKNELIMKQIKHIIDGMYILHIFNIVVHFLFDVGYHYKIRTIKVSTKNIIIFFQIPFTPSRYPLSMLHKCTTFNLHIHLNGCLNPFFSSSKYISPSISLVIYWFSLPFLSSSFSPNPFLKLLQTQPT